MNSKVQMYERKLKGDIKAELWKMVEFQEEKKFYSLNTKENVKLLNEYYLPQLHSILDKKPRKGQKVVEVVDRGVQYESGTVCDWSGQWSSDENGDEDDSVVFPPKMKF